MRYLVTARVKAGPGVAAARRDRRRHARPGSVAGDEYIRNMASARRNDDGRPCPMGRGVLSARRRSRKSGSTGRNTSLSKKSRTPTRAAAAAT